MADSARVIAIDGPSGSGKGTISLAIAERLGWHLLDSGVLYRLVALAASGEKLDPESPADIQDAADLARDLDARFVPNAQRTPRVLLAGADVSRAIRSQECGEMASRWAGRGPIREALLQRQRDFRRPPGLVADGRDMGTTVFPDAGVKVFLWASARERARRRFAQLEEMGRSGNFEEIHAEILERDRRDMERTHSPLTPAPDAWTLDTTEMSPRDAVQTILGWLD